MRAELIRFLADPDARARLILKGMWDVDLHLGVARATQVAGGDPVRLTQEECEILYWAERCLDLGAIVGRTGRGLAQLAGVAAALAERDLVELRAGALPPTPGFQGSSSRSQTVQALWLEASRRFPARPLLIAGGDASAFSFGEVAEIVARAAAALRRDGIAPGDVVCICAPFGPEAVFTAWACLQEGVVLAPLDWSAAPERSSSLLAWLCPRLVFADAPRLAAVPDGLPRIVFDDGPAEGSASATPFSQWLAAGADVRPAPVDAEAIAALLPTSGTSGEPKFVEILQGGLCRSATRTAHAFGWNDEDLILSTGDLHAVAVLRACAGVIDVGAAMLALGVDERRSPMALAEAVQRHGVTILFTNPGLLRLLTQFEGRLPPASLSSLRQVISTGSPLSPAVAEAFRLRFGLPVLDCYGLTETTGANVILRPEDADRCPRGSIGKPVGCIVQIVGDDGAVLGPGREGEVRIYTDNLMRGYRTRGAGAAPSVRDGWFYTGDIAVRDEEGFLTLKSRRRDAIKDVRGDLVHPGEVEEVLLRHPRVEDAGVCGYLSPSGEERMAAFVVPRQAVDDAGAFADELRRHVLQHLGPYRVPARVEVVDSLPRLPDGALLRRDLATRCA